MYDHFRDEHGTRDIPAEENMAYFNLTVKNGLSDKISETKFSFERNMSYSSSSSVKKTISDGVAQERVYDTINDEPGKQSVLAKIYQPYKLIVLLL